ncbi:MAG: hypothetical protein ACOYJG_05845 [Prevotella sp.]|jgi:hypothetical protein
MMERKMWMRMALSVFILALMAGIADCFEEKELIFPEVAALAVGLWIMPKRIWNVHSIEVPFIMTVSAVTGVLIVRYVAAPVFVQFTLAFCVAALFIMLFHIPLVPALAAMLLPVLLDTRTWSYPLSVALMTTLVAYGAVLMGRFGLKPSLSPVSPRSGITSSSLWHWISSYLLLLPLLFVATYFDFLFAIVPPLVIILIELRNPSNMFRNRPVALLGAVVFISVIGTLSRLALLEWMQLPYVVALPVAYTLSLIYMFRSKLMFPPLPALAVIPFILPDTYLLYPLEATVGGAYAIIMARVGIPSVFTSLFKRMV